MAKKKKETKFRFRLERGSHRECKGGKMYRPGDNVESDRRLDKIFGKLKFTHLKGKGSKPAKADKPAKAAAPAKKTESDDGIELVRKGSRYVVEQDGVKVHDENTLTKKAATALIKSLRG